MRRLVYEHRFLVGFTAGWIWMLFLRAVLS